jgi:hypothetical protein
MIIMSSMIVIFFLGGWSFFILDSILYTGIIFSIKTVGIAYLFILVRALLPRYRFDQLMQLSWKTMLPLALGFFIFSGSVLVGFDIMPDNTWLYSDSSNIYRLYIVLDYSRDNTGWNISQSGYDWYFSKDW